MASSVFSDGSSTARCPVVDMGSKALLLRNHNRAIEDNLDLVCLVKHSANPHEDRRFLPNSHQATAGKFPDVVFASNGLTAIWRKPTAFAEIG